MYRFNLDPLLNHRRYQEEILQKELAGLKIRLAAEKDKLRVLKKKKRQYLGQLQLKQQSGRPVSEIRLYLHFVDHLSKEMNAQNQRVLRAEKGFNLKRQDLIQAMKKRKTLEKLQEKGFQAHQQKMLKKERDSMDEVAGNQFNLRR